MQKILCTTWLIPRILIFNAIQKVEYTALSLAASRGHAEVVDRLVQAGADIDQKALVLARNYYGYYCNYDL